MNGKVPIIGQKPASIGPKEAIAAINRQDSKIAHIVAVVFDAQGNFKLICDDQPVTNLSMASVFLADCALQPMRNPRAAQAMSQAASVALKQKIVHEGKQPANA